MRIWVFIPDISVYLDLMNLLQSLCYYIFNWKNPKALISIWRYLIAFFVFAVEIDLVAWKKPS